MGKTKYYAVAKGFKTGIFETWVECQAQVNNFRGASYKSFTSREGAEDYMKKEGKHEDEEKDKKLSRTRQQAKGQKKEITAGKKGKEDQDI